MVLAADANFCKQLAVAIASLARQVADRPYRVFILHTGYERELMRRIERSSRGNLELHWIEASADAPERFLASDFYRRVGSAALFRLQMEQLLPADVDRLIYLDADVIVRAPLLGLWQVDLRGTLAGAVRDALFPWSLSALDWRGLAVPPERPYFNSGVLVVPLDRWRTERVSGRALDFLARNDLRYGDQCALNLAVAGTWAPLDPRWNVQSGHLVEDQCPAWIAEPRPALEQALEDPAVVHFTTAHRTRRPWEPWASHPYRGEWYELLDSTPWSGWRPVSRRRGPLARATRRAAKAGRLLLRGKE